MFVEKIAVRIMKKKKKSLLHRRVLEYKNNNKRYAFYILRSF